MTPLRIALVGAGTQGQNWARVIAHSGHVLSAVVDVQLGRAQALGQRYGVPWETGLSADIKRADAVVVAASTAEHAIIASGALAFGKPVLVEKPLADTTKASAALVNTARTLGVPLMCGFVERFNPAITTVMDLLADTPIIHATSVRHSPRDSRVYSHVIDDLLIHDLDLLVRFMHQGRNHECTGIIAATHRSREVTDCVLNFGNGATLATLSASRLSQRKIRQWRIATARQLYEIDLLRADVTVYQNTDDQMSAASYRSQTIMDIPFVRHAGEPLALQLNHFVDLACGRVDMTRELDSIMPAHNLAFLVEAW